MSKATEFLEVVEEKLKKKIEEISQTITAVSQDIQEMNTYYWENYTEMDEYGYENYDNQQALRTQVKANQENIQTRNRLEKMVDSPFFGSIDFVYEGEEEPETFYIGIGSFSERAGSQPLLYDWRAPISSLFYDYEEKGPASYEAPGGSMTGEILSRRQYKIRQGRMMYELESDLKVDDDILKEELSKNGDVKLKNIIHTIQKEQNAIIRNTKDRVLVIQGAAGSGKTSIALHRIAYLLYHDRQHLKSSNILILSPNGVFSDYISHILPELGEENIREMSFDLFAYRELKSVAEDCEDRYDFLERQIQGKLSARSEERYRYKQSEKYIYDLEGFLIDLEDRLVNLTDITYKKHSKTKEELRILFYQKFSTIPVLSRMDVIREYFEDEYETLYKPLTEDEKVELKEKFYRMYVTRDIYRIYNWFLQEKGFPQLKHVPLEERVLPYEDVYPILYLKYRLLHTNAHKRVRHLVVDEMQDYSYLQYVILEKLFPCSKTILGDRCQSVDSETQDVFRFLPSVLGKDIRMMELKKSYRNTLEIAAYAEKMSEVSDIEYVARHGKEVWQEEVSDSGEACQKILSQLNLNLDGYETAALLTMTEKEAREAYEHFKAMGVEAFYMDRDSSRFAKGLTVTTFYLAKGLEFDQVFVLGGNQKSPLYRQYQYIAATRALHELYVYQVRG
jgi:DNA helicase-2/ATP-dependent DNA helicase PcrA